MKFSFRTFLHNSFEVFRRNTIVLNYLFINGLIFYLFAKGFISFLVVIVLAYFPIKLIWSLIEFVLDYLDSVFILHGLSDFRKHQYHKKLQRDERRRKGIKRLGKVNIMMPYQTAAHTGLPQMMLFDTKDKKDL